MPKIIERLESRLVIGLLSAATRALHGPDVSLHFTPGFIPPSAPRTNVNITFSPPRVGAGRCRETTRKTIG